MKEDKGGGNSVKKKKKKTVGLDEQGMDDLEKFLTDEKSSSGNYESF